MKTKNSKPNKISSPKKLTMNPNRLIIKGLEEEKKMPQRLADRVLNPVEVAGLLNIKLPTLFSHLSRGTDLPLYFRVGSQTRWRESVVWEWILQRETERKRRNFE